MITILVLNYNSIKQRMTGKNYIFFKVVVQFNNIEMLFKIRCEGSF